MRCELLCARSLGFDCHVCGGSGFLEIIRHDGGLICLPCHARDFPGDGGGCDQ